MPYPQEPETLGDHLKKRRHELSLFQKDVALRLSVNDWTICNWENNKTTPAVRFLPRIIDFLGYYPFPAPETLGERLLAYRKHLGLSRKEAAERLSLGEGTVRNWETGTAKPREKGFARVEGFLSEIAYVSE